MQSLAVERSQRRPGGLVELVDLGAEAAAIDGIAQKRMAERGKMHANLVSAPRLQPAAYSARERIGGVWEGSFPRHIGA